MSKPDYLSEDTLLPKDQKFVCLSFLSDKENKTTLTGVKVRGVFETYDEACKQAKNLQAVDEAFNVFVGEMGKWLPFDPAPDSEAVKNSEYANEELNNMMKSYLENQEKAKLFHEQRKNELMRKNIMDNITTRQTNLKEVQEQLTSASGEEKTTLEESVKSIEEQIEKMMEKKKELEEQLDTIKNSLKGTA